jgi:hypothetical protein
MDIREYLQTKEKGFYKTLCNSMTVERRKQFYDAINNWHESELKLLNIHSVVGRSEQLSCGRNITTCVFYKDGGKCGNLEYCRDQTT